MTVKINFPEPPQVPAELPLYATVRPAWTAESVAQLGKGFALQGDVVDAGNWYVLRDHVFTLEVYQASQSVRLERNGFDFEGRVRSDHLPDRSRALAAADRFQEIVGGTGARTELHSVTELAVSTSTRESRAAERRVVALQVNYRYALDGVALVGPGAKAQVTVGGDGQIAQAYRFFREVKRVGTRASVPPSRAFERFAASALFAGLSSTAKATVRSVQVGLLCLPPTEVQGVLVPVYVMRGVITTELLPQYEFINYVAAADLDEVEAKRQRWPLVRPSLVLA
jgi:hypothetical protein